MSTNPIRLAKGFWIFLIVPTILLLAISWRQFVDFCNIQLGAMELARRAESVDYPTFSKIQLVMASGIFVPVLCLLILWSTAVIYLTRTRISNGLIEPKPPPFRAMKGISIVLSLFATLVLGAYALAPYLYSEYLEAKLRTQYVIQWPISETDYRMVKKMAEKELGGFEFIERVIIDSPTKITFFWMQYHCGGSSGGGGSIVIEKNDGQWIMSPIRGRWDY